MPKRISVIFAILFIIFLSACNSKPKTPDEHPLTLNGAVTSTSIEQLSGFPNTFAYSNKEGTQIITCQNLNTFDEKGDYDNIDTAIGKYGKVIPVSYMRIQDSTDEDTGQQTSVNFENIAGYVYKVENANVKSTKETTFYMVNKNTFDINTLINFSSTKSEQLKIDSSNDVLIKNIETASSRNINTLWKIGSLENGASLYFASYKPKEDLETSSIIYKKDEKIIFSDYSLSQNKFNGSTPEMFNILFVQNKNDRINIGIEWIDEEGADLSIQSENNGKFERVLDSFKYFGTK